MRSTSKQRLDNQSVAKLPARSSALSGKDSKARYGGRPLIKSLAYGSSIPHIDPADLIDHKIVRLNPAEESTIADLAEASAMVRADADMLERAIAQDASAIIERHSSRPWNSP
jgi:hypothetical protein